jgi:flagellar assembly protein FliH
LHDPEKSTIDKFDFFKFSKDKPELSNEHSNELSSISLPNFEKEEKVKKTPNVPKTEKNTDSEKLEDENKKAETEAELAKRRENIISSAKKEADNIIKQAEAEADEIKKRAYSEGTDKGYEEGFNKAYEENKVKLDEGTVSFLLNLKDLLNDYKEEKDKLITDNIDELKDLTITIAEKIVHVSLETSGDIIKKMIISATEKMRCKEWAKIYISKNDSSLLVEGNTDLLKAISHLSEHIKITVMEAAAPGTCIIELPDQIIDASAATQLDNIKGILKGVSIGGGNDDVQ